MVVLCGVHKRVVAGALPRGFLMVGARVAPADQLDNLANTGLCSALSVADEDTLSPTETLIIRRQQSAPDAGEQDDIASVLTCPYGNHTRFQTDHRVDHRRTGAPQHLLGVAHVPLCRLCANSLNGSGIGITFLIRFLANAIDNQATSRIGEGDDSLQNSPLNSNWPLPLL